ncbi:MAG: peptidoglycan-binding domain-containing protein [bacterium]
MFKRKIFFVLLLSILFLGCSNTLRAEIISPGLIIDILIAGDMVAKDKLTQARALSLALKTGYFYIYNPVFNRNLTLGMTGSDVMALKRVLNTDEATAMSYTDGSIFGPKPELFDQETFDAVKKFQEKYSDEILKPNNLTEGTGNVGVSTRAKLNKIEFEIEIRAYAIKYNIPLSKLAPYLVSDSGTSTSGGATGSVVQEDQTVQIRNLVSSIFSGSGDTSAVSVYNVFNAGSNSGETATNPLQVQVMSSNYSPAASSDPFADGTNAANSNPYYYNNSNSTTNNNYYYGSSTDTTLSNSNGGDSDSSSKYTFGGKIVDVRYCGSTGDIAASIEESKDNGSTTVNIYFFDSGESAAKGMSVMGYASQSLTFCATCKNNGKYGCYKNGKKVIAYYYTK